MTTRTEPNVLQTRITMFILTGLVVTFGVLGTTVYSMFPLDRPQIFFLRTSNRENQDVQVVNYIPKSDEALKNYKITFVNEYIQHRNEIYANQNAMQKKWNSNDGAIRIWSDDAVYNAFSKTNAFRKYMSNTTPDKTCSVIITETLPLTVDVRIENKERYQVGINYRCIDIYGNTTDKSYKIHVDITTDKTKLKWKNRLDNPLGLKVTQYKVVDGQTDPLDME